MGWNEGSRNFIFAPDSNWTLIWHLLLYNIRGVSRFAPAIPYLHILMCVTHCVCLNKCQFISALAALCKLTIQLLSFVFLLCNCKTEMLSATNLWEHVRVRHLWGTSGVLMMHFDFWKLFFAVGFWQCHLHLFEVWFNQLLTVWPPPFAAQLNKTAPLCYKWTTI